MPKNQGKLTRFWQELKRRKVFGVVTTYAATAYIIIEVTNNLVGPLNLPAWIAKLVILLLGAGLPVAVILSWMFDFTPQGIKKTESFEEIEKKETLIKPVKRKLRPSYILNAVLIIAVIILAYPKIFKRNTLEKLRSSGERISVAVMPFQNMTNDITLNVWQDGIQEILTNYLSNSNELRVRQTESIKSLIQSKGLTNYASITPLVASTISQKLDAKFFICGKLIQANKILRVYAQLIESDSKEVFKSFQKEGAPENILPMIDSLSKMVQEFIIISLLKKKVTIDEQHFAVTSSPDAFRYYMKGQDAFGKFDMPTAREWYLKALEIDSNFVDAGLQVSFSYENQGLYDEGKKWFLRFYNKKDIMPPIQKVWINYTYAYYFETPNEEIKYLRQLQVLDDLLPTYYFLTGSAYMKMFQWDKAIPELEKALKTDLELNSKPFWAPVYTVLGRAYRKSGQFKKCKKLFRLAEKYFPDDQELVGNEACLSLAEGDTLEANRYIEKFKSILKSSPMSDADVAAIPAYLYNDAEIPDKAEEYFRKALSLEPANPARMNSLAYVLIDKDRNINEGLELVEKALKINPNSYNSQHIKGWGLYKQGKYKEALDLLQKSWDLRREKALYNHEAYLHLEAAKKAVAGQR